MGLFDGLKSGAEKLAGAGADVAMTGIGIAGKLGKGMLSMLFPSEQETPFDFIGKAGQGTVEAGGEMLASVGRAVGPVVGAVGDVAKGALSEIGDMKKTIGAATHVPDKLSAQLPSQPVGTADPAQRTVV